MWVAAGYLHFTANASSTGISVKSMPPPKIPDNDADGRPQSSSLTSGRLLAKNTIINLIGYGLPLLVAVFAMPTLIEQLGDKRFGILVLAWVIIGYLSLLDLGLSRALMQQVADKLGSGKTAGIESFIWTALSLMALVSAALGVVVLVCLPWIVKVLNIPNDLHQEALHGFTLLTVSLPVIVVSVGLKGVMAAYQRFDLINVVRIPMGIYSFIAPLGVLPFTHDLRVIIVCLIIGRILGTLVQFQQVFKITPLRIRNFHFVKSLIGPLIRSGGWMTVTNAVSPVMVHLDRFFITSLVSVGAVTYYATPHEVLTKMLLISGSLTAVLFPAFSADYNVNRSKVALNYQRGIKYIFGVLFYGCLIALTFAREGMTLWMGADFADRSTTVTQLLAVSVFFAGIGQMPYALVQGIGRPELTGKFQLIELPFFCLILYCAVRWGGINGTALMALARSIVETGGLLFLAGYLMRAEGFDYKKWIAPLLGALTLFGIGIAIDNTLIKLIFIFFVSIPLFVLTWKRWLAADEKEWLMNFIRQFRK